MGDRCLRYMVVIEVGLLRHGDGLYKLDMVRCRPSWNGVPPRGFHRSNGPGRSQLVLMCPHGPSFDYCLGGGGISLPSGRGTADPDSSFH
jgi:hypothetical protein